MQELLRTLCFFFDNVIYGLISKVYELVVYLANVDIFTNNDVISELMNRIYVLLGIFMLFKVSFSIIQYVIDPNSFSDKSKGFGKLITNALVTVILLISIPAIFHYAFGLQAKILESNIIGELILGGSASNGFTKNATNDASKVGEMAKDVQFMMFGAFYSLNTEVDAFKACQGPNENVFGSVSMASNEDCLNAVNGQITEYSETSARGVTLKDFFKLVDCDDNDENCTVTDNRRFESFDAMLWWKIDNQFVINYLPGISTLAGVYLLLLLLTFCIDIAVRVFKLCFLQMVAPIAVVSYIDPKESVSQSKLRNWTMETLKTFFSLFLRLAVIFLVIRLVQMISDMVILDGLNYYNGMDAPESYNMFIYVFLILGAFMFAKKVPEMIEKIFGIKMSGDLHMNPFKNDAMAAGLGLTIGGIGGAMAGFKAGSEAGAPIRGLAAGLYGGARNGFANKGSKELFSNTRNRMYKQLTGNEMKVFNPYEKLMGIGGQKKVDQIDTPLKEARNQMTEAQSKLNRVSNASATAYNNLLNNGVDVSNVEGARSAIQSRIASAQSRQTASEGKINSLKAQREQKASAKAQAEKDLARLNRQMEKLTSSSDPHSNEELKKFSALETKLQGQITDADRAMSSIDNQITQVKSSMDSEQVSIDNDNKLLSDISTYTNSLDEENNLRSEIEKIQKNIDTLSEEKSQRKTFYGVDDSTQQKVSDAIAEVRDRQL